MRRNALLPALAASLFLVIAAPLRAQVLDAILLDARAREPIAGADMALLDASGAPVARGRTGDDGRVRLRAPAPGTWRVRASRDGTVLIEGPVELVDGETAEVELLAGAVASAVHGDGTVELDPLVAEAAVRRRYLSNAGFYDRQRTSSGVFLTGEEFAERGGARMVDRLVGMRGISVRPAGATGWVIYQRTPPGSAGAASRCATRLWVDGVPQPTTVLSNIRPQDVEAVEVYDPVEVPLRFGRTNAAGRPSCGAVVMWLKEPKA